VRAAFERSPERRARWAVLSVLAKDPKTITVLMESLLDRGVAPDVLRRASASSWG
jgi:hypothetical protein